MSRVALYYIDFKLASLLRLSWLSKWRGIPSHIIVFTFSQIQEAEKYPQARYSR